MSLVKRLAGAALTVLPEGVRGRLLPEGYRYSVRDIPPPLDVPSGARIRLLIAPTNFAGQARLWADAIERLVPDAAARNLVERSRTDFRHPADLVVPRGVFAASRRWHRSIEAGVAAGFTHLLIESGKPPFGAVLVDTVERQVERIGRAGVRVALVFHGTDIRSPARHLRAEPDSPFAGALATAALRLERNSEANREFAVLSGLPVFVSTPGLLEDAPGSRWLPVVVDPSSWAGGAPALDRATPIVLHAPSAGAVKGSDVVDPVLRALDAEGLVEYRRLEHVPFERMQDAVREADIVLDQFRLGDYGVAACEAMAAGRVVVGHVSREVRDTVRREADVELPIVESRLGDLERTIRRLVEDRSSAREAAAVAPDFVARLHDGRRSAEVLRSFLYEV